MWIILYFVLVSKDVSHDITDSNIMVYSHPLQFFLFDGPLLFIHENIGSKLYSMLYNFTYYFF